MKRVAVFTGTRAEYGLLSPLMKRLQASDDFELQVIAAAMHLSPEFGETWRDIEADGFVIDARVEMLLSSNSAAGVAKSMGLGTIGFADALDRLKPDWLVILGDRFEALAVAQAALVMGVPIAHVHGGEVTEGAYDDAIRHAITKMASLHFTASEPYRRRVIQMGEQPATVFNVGALGLENLRSTELPDLPTISKSLGFTVRQPFVLATYHAVTAGDEDPVTAVSAMLEALDAFPHLQVIATYPNADNGGRAIIPLLENFAQQQPGRVLAIPSLGMRRYAGLLARAAAMVGNSSSGIIEAPAFSTPTVDIGARQRGRLAAASVLHCPPVAAAIRDALAQALSPEFKVIAAAAENLYGSGATSAGILDILRSATTPRSKAFFDIGQSA